MRIYARIEDNLVRELFETDLNIQDCFGPPTVWADVTDHDPVIGQNDTAVQVNGEWVFTTYVVPTATPEQILASQSYKLQQLTQTAAAQKLALMNRVSTLNDAIELEMATPEEEVELAKRTLQLKAWKTYAVLLGRVTSQVGWPPEVIWPTQPTEGMDLTVSATNPQTS